MTVKILADNRDAGGRGTLLLRNEAGDWHVALNQWNKVLGAYSAQAPRHKPGPENGFTDVSPSTSTHPLEFALIELVRAEPAPRGAYNPYGSIVFNIAPLDL